MSDENINMAQQAIRGGLGANEDWEVEQAVQYLLHAKKIEADAAMMERVRKYLREKTGAIMALAKQFGALDS